MNSHTYYIPSFGLPSYSGLHSALSRVPCAIQNVLISYLFYIVPIVYLWQSKAPVPPTPPPTLPLGIHIFVVYVSCLYFCFANKIIYTIFLNSTSSINTQCLFFSF